MDEKILEQMQQKIDQASLNTDRLNLARLQQDQFLEKEEKSMVDSQLDLSELIINLDYLLKGYSQQPNKEGELVWTEPSEDMKIFTDYGIQLVMNTLGFYLNKNTLLSNYKEEEIKRKMLSFTRELTLTVFSNYNKVFIYPSVEECIDILKDRLRRRAKITSYANELKGVNVSEEDVYRQKIKEIEDKIEIEIEKIQQNVRKEKFTRFAMLIRCIQDPVNSAYNRAWNGQERASLRQHMTISETKGNHPTPQQRGGIFSWGKN